MDKDNSNEVAVMTKKDKKISVLQQRILIHILKRLIAVIVEIRKLDDRYRLLQHESEAIDWLAYLMKHRDIEEIKSLENEIGDRYFYRYGNPISYGKLEDRRIRLLRKYQDKSSKYTNRYNR